LAGSLPEGSAIAWELSERYDATFGLAFSTYAWRLLRLRVATWYRDEQKKSGDQHTPSSNTSSPRTTTLPRQVDWSALSARSRATLTLIAIPASEGWSLDDVAQHGRPRRWASRLLRELPDEIEALSESPDQGDP
jgi:hypothetical protein